MGENEIKLPPVTEAEAARLAAISVACQANTRESAARLRLPPGSPFVTAAYLDACAAVNREMDLRARLAEAEGALREGKERERSLANLLADIYCAERREGWEKGPTLDSVLNAAMHAAANYGIDVFVRLAYQRGERDTDPTALLAAPAQGKENG